MYFYYKVLELQKSIDILNDYLNNKKTPKLFIKEKHLNNICAFQVLHNNHQQCTKNYASVKKLNVKNKTGFKFYI